MADPRDGDVQDLSLDLLNCFINGALGMLFDSTLSLEQNIAQAHAYYTKWGKPSAANLEKARALIEKYNQNVALEDIGYSDTELIKDLYLNGETATNKPGVAIKPACSSLTPKIEQ